MHIDSRVAEDADFKYEIQFNSQGNWGCYEAARASKATKMIVKSNMCMALPHYPLIYRAIAL